VVIFPPLPFTKIRIPENPAYGGTIVVTTVVLVVEVTLTKSDLGLIVVVKAIVSSEILVVVPGIIPTPPRFQD
jgi:hypothetical protein